VTASVEAVGALGADGMANRGELLINVVTTNKPKMLTGLTQKGIVTRCWGCVLPNHSRNGHRRIGSAYPIRAIKWNVVSPYLSRTGKRAVRQTNGDAGRRGRKKQRPSCNGMDRG
jgi:hypothetical protein